MIEVSNILRLLNSAPTLSWNGVIFLIALGWRITKTISLISHNKKYNVTDIE